MVKIDRTNVKNSGTWQYKYKNKKLEICIHETGNTGSGAGAVAHAKLQSNGNTRKANWHYQVDDKQAIQSYSENAQLWHGGDYTANTIAIAVEICVNSDGDYNKAVENAIELVVDIAKRNKIPVSRVYTHNHYSGKNCPTRLLSGRYKYNVAQFKYQVNKRLTGASSKPVKPSGVSKKSINTMASEVIRGNHGNGHGTRRKSLGVDITTYNKVKKEVNNRLSTKTNKPSKSINTMVNEVIRGIHGNGHNKRRKSLGVSRKVYEKVKKEVNNRYR